MTPIEELARWMHETSQRLNVFLPRCTWDEIAKWTPDGQVRYRAVAAEMLANPPAVLVNAIAAKNDLAAGRRFGYSDFAIRNQVIYVPTSIKRARRNRSLAVSPLLARIALRARLLDVSHA